MRRVAFVNEKGGTGKTTLAVHAAARLAELGHRVLLVDLDTQGHAGKSLGLDVRDLTPTVYDWLLDADLPLAKVVRETGLKGLSLVPANKRLGEYPLAVAYDRERCLRLGQRLAQAEGAYDVVVIDAPPSSGLFIETALVAATDVVIPVATQYLALDGCAEIVRTMDVLREAYARPDLQVAQVVPTMYRRTALADEIVRKVHEYFPTAACGTTVGVSVQVDEAQSHGRTVWAHAPKSKGALMLRAVSDELAGRLGLARRVRRTAELRA